jgi:hypothetical protein
MNTDKILAIIILIFGLGLNTTFAQKKTIHPKKIKNYNRTGQTTDFKTLATGNQSKVEKPFIFIARDAATYAELQKLVEGLPATAEIDFSANAVVAGFAGTKTTGGFSVDMKNDQNKVAINIRKPGKEMMVTQMITSPYKVVLVPVSENIAVLTTLSDDFSAVTENYTVSIGDFGFSGGFAGRQKKFTADGKIQVLIYENLATFVFDLIGKETEAKRQLAETASGTLKDGKINLARLDAGSFADNPHPPFAVAGTLINSKLTLTFEPLPTNIADGYIGRGNLEAIVRNAKK